MFLFHPQFFHFTFAMSEYKARREFLRTSFVANKQFIAQRKSVHETTVNKIDDMYDQQHMGNVALDDQQRMVNIENNEQNMEIVEHDTTTSSGHIQFNNDNTVSAEEISLVIYKKKDTCNGDSGGPLLKLYDNRWTLMGVVSNGDASCSGTGIYTNIPFFYDWINSNIHL